ncbi:hydrolase [Selenomonas sp. oral taxon 126]|uniref:metal-dependent hydrolase n=1 Tax=Selenomonas sp. oral taxon 126 TaxID=712528 RepID=UPI0008079C7E|nr:metal-dependent hydrolase [Selenomonas sp. oral taxon 126]ANR70230.1 hydrolase [Selenomonas sp. oral taxon 126]
MTWVSHIAVTGTIVYAVTTDPLLTAAAAVGAVLPDKVEGSPGSVGWNTWRSRHRGWSHWPVLYLALIGGLAQARAYFFYDAAFFSVLTWLFIGALLHIAEDAVCGKVPGIFPMQKIGIRLFTVGSFREYLFAGFCIIVVYAGQYILRM